MALTVLILGSLFLFLRMTHTGSTFLCSSAACQTEASEARKAPRREDEKTLNLPHYSKDLAKPGQASKNAPKRLLNTSGSTPAHLAALLYSVTLFTSP